MSEPKYNKDSMKNILVVSLLVCFACSVVVSSAAVFLKPQRVANKDLDRNKNILEAAGLYDKQSGQNIDIAAEFEISALPHVLSFLENADLDTEACVLRRAVDATGRSRAWINGVPVTVKQLKEIGALLVDIHGQHEHYSLMDSSSHSRVLDSFGNLTEATSAIYPLPL